MPLTHEVGGIVVVCLISRYSAIPLARGRVGAGKLIMPLVLTAHCLFVRIDRMLHTALDT